MFKKLTVLAFLLFGIYLNAQAQEPDYNSVWEASSGAFPDEICPAWLLINSADIEVPIL